jgi:Concanavalin A-like lectin/glucanases superfamily
MKQRQFRNFGLCVLAVLTTGVMISGCDDDEDDVPLPPIGGYNSSNDVAAANLKAHWTFDNTQKERFSGVDPAQAVAATYITGRKGQAVSLNNGYLYYTGVTGLSSVTTAFSVSTWFQVQNNLTGVTGARELFQWVRANPSTAPNDAFGNINFTLETGVFKNTPATGYDTLMLKPTYRDQTGGLQDNTNNYPMTAATVVKDTAGKWIHSIITYDPTTHLFNIWANGVKVGNYPDRGTNVFTPTASTAAVIGAWISNVTGIGVTPQGFTLPFLGAIDEVRVYNKALLDSEISALYLLEMAGR